MRRIILLAIVSLAATACGAEDTGSLEAITNGTGSGFGDFSAGNDKSFGIFLCTNGGSVELEAIEPMALDGDIEFLGGSIYTSPDEFIGAADGYLPDAVDEERVEPLEGARLDIDCVGPEGDDRVQLLIGVERTGTGGGSLDGVVIRNSGGQPLFIDYEVLLCGDELEYCEILESEDA